MTKVVLTFDDAQISHYAVAFPELKKRGFVGVLYVPTNMVGCEGKLSWSQILEMYHAGWEVGSHTVSHPRLTEQTKEGIIYELSRSKLMLQSSGIHVTSFAAPFNDVNATVNKLIFHYYNFQRDSCNFVDQNTDWQNLTQFIKSQRGDILVFGWHTITDQPSTAYDCRTDDFIWFLDWLQSQPDIRVYTFTQVCYYERSSMVWLLIAGLCGFTMPILYFSPVVRATN